MAIAVCMILVCFVCPHLNATLVIMLYESNDKYRTDYLSDKCIRFALNIRNIIGSFDILYQNNIFCNNNSRTYY